MLMIAVSLALGLSVATAQDGADEAVEEIIVGGTRRAGRTKANTPVPVDVFNRQELESVSSDDMLDIIKTLVPSFQVERFPSGRDAGGKRPENPHENY